MNSAEKIQIYVLFKRPFTRVVRILTFLLLLLWVYGDIVSNTVPRLSLFLLSWFLFFETIFNFVISRIFPSLTLDKTDEKSRILASTMPVLLAEYQSSSTVFVEKILQFQQSKFLLSRMGVTPKEVSVIELNKEQLFEQAAAFAKSISGSYISSFDVLTAYLHLTEHETKILFDHKINANDLLEILRWTHVVYDKTEIPQKLRAHFDGAGVGEFLVTGWTPETAKYTSDFTYKALKNPPHIKGREKEFDQMVHTLLKTSNNNVLLVGETGAGKENLVDALSYKSYTGSLPGNLDNKRVLQLMLGPLIAGMDDRGELESRIQAIIAEVSHAGNVILYLPDFQNILGSSSYKIDLSGALLPYLQDGKLCFVATLTPGNYKTYVEQNPLKEVFDVIQLSEPDETNAMQMLFDKAFDIENKNHVYISFDGLRSSVTLADRYMQDATLPGSAVLLLEDSANVVSLSTKPPFGDTKYKLVTEDDVIKTVESKSHVPVAAPTGQEKEMLLNMEDLLHKRVVNQVQAISEIAEAMRRLRTGLSSKTKPISFLFLGPTGVGKTETAKALASVYFGGEEHMVRLDMSEYTDESGVRRLLGAPPGQGDERGELTDKIHDNPASLVLLDEFEKANPQILNLFLQVLDDGRLTDNKGRTVSFLNTIIIATSNAGSEFIRQEVKKGISDQKAFHQKLLEELQSTGTFRPELLNRFDDVVTFMPLGKKEIQAITMLLLQGLIAKLAEQDITVTFDEAVIAKIATDGSDEQFGARPVRRYIQDKIEDLLAQMKLRDELKRGNTAIVSLSSDGNIKVAVT